jgi:hypothetical protein
VDSWVRFKKWFDRDILLWPDAPTHETATGIFFCLACVVIVFVMSYFGTMRVIHTMWIDVIVAVVVTLGVSYLYVRPTFKKHQ